MYSLDIRKQALVVYSKLQSLRKTALLLDIHFSSISRWVSRLERKPYTCRKFSKESIIVDSIHSISQTNPLTSTRVLTTKLKSVFNINISRELVRVVIKKLGYTKKKARFVNQPKFHEEKLSEFLQIRESLIDREFFSIDETSFGRNSFEDKGYSLKGQKLYISKKQPRMTSQSVCACASRTGWVGFHKKEGSFNTQSFLQFLKTLNLPSSSVLLLDNVSFHHSKVILGQIKNVTP
jgi:transposase